MLILASGRSPKSQPAPPRLLRGSANLNIERLRRVWKKQDLSLDLKRPSASTINSAGGRSLSLNIISIGSQSLALSLFARSVEGSARAVTRAVTRPIRLPRRLNRGLISSGWPAFSSGKAHRSRFRPRAPSILAFHPQVKHLARSTPNRNRSKQIPFQVLFRLDCQPIVTRQLSLHLEDRIARNDNRLFAAVRAERQDQTN